MCSKCVYPSCPLVSLSHQLHTAMHITAFTVYLHTESDNPSSCRRFLLHWCSGLSLSDLLLITFWLTVNFSWFSVITSRNIHKKIAKLHLLPADLTNTNHITTSSSSTDYDKAVPNSLIQTMQLVRSAFRHHQQQGSSDQQLIIIKTVYKCVARSLGALLYPNLAVLFYPVSRGSVVLQAMNIPYPAAIRYDL